MMEGDKMARYLELETDVIKLKIRRELERGRNKFILYPFGYFGQYTKKILNNEFNIKECFILDNYARDEKVYPLDFLKTYSLKDEYVLVTSLNSDIYDEIRSELKKYVPEDRIIDLFEKECFIHQIKEKYDEHIAKVSGFDFDNTIYHLKRYNVKFYLPYWRTDLIQQRILFSDRYYEDDLLFFITSVFRGGVQLKNQVVLDIGANIGNHSIYFAKECGAEQIIAFEPVRKTFDILKKNIEINDLEKKVRLYNCGVGEIHSSASVVEYNLNNIGGTTLQNSENGNIEIYSIGELNFDEEIALIKIDVEGYEEQVVRGALQLIKRCKPTMMIEAWDRSDTIYNIIKLLTPLGYEFQYFESENYIFYCK